MQSEPFNYKNMFFYLSKILSFLISPAIILLVLLLIALLAKSPAVRKRFLVISTGLFIIFSNPYLINQLFKFWELRNEKDYAGRYDAVVILSGFMGKDKSNNSLSFTEGADRLTEGLILYKKGYVNKIIISGGTGSLVDDTRESVLAKTFLIENCGVPDSVILIDSVSRNTYENAVESKKLMGNNNIRTAVIITSAWHMRRALGCFKKIGLNVSIHPTDGFYRVQTYYPTDLIIPVTRNLSRWEILIHEIAGVIIYKLQGYI